MPREDGQEASTHMNIHTDTHSTGKGLGTGVTFAGSRATRHASGPEVSTPLPIPARHSPCGTHPPAVYDACTQFDYRRTNSPAARITTLKPPHN